MPKCSDADRLDSWRDGAHVSQPPQETGRSEGCLRVLWVTNVPVREASALMGLPEGASGGWLTACHEILASSEQFRLLVTFPGAERWASGWRGRGLLGEYASFPRASATASPMTEASLSELMQAWRPDLVHIHGTEYAHSLIACRVATRLAIPVVVSIQGVVNSVAEHYLSGLPTRTRLIPTPRDLLRRDTIRRQQAELRLRGGLERAVLRSCQHVIGRTDFDRAYAQLLSPTSTYHHCEEAIRANFFVDSWDLAKIDRNSIFLSQGYYPVKGLHRFLEAFPLVLDAFPDAHIYVAGPDPIGTTAWQGAKRSSYAKLLNGLLAKHRLRQRVTFLGVLGEDELRGRLRTSHVNLLASVVENSPNSLCEAMLVGVPCVAAYVGGVPSLIDHGTEGLLYQADSSVMASYYIRQVLSDDNRACELSRQARTRALRRHSPESILERLEQIYQDVAQG